MKKNIIIADEIDEQISKLPVAPNVELTCDPMSDPIHWLNAKAKKPNATAPVITVRIKTISLLKRTARLSVRESLPSFIRRSKYSFRDE